jgi:hypothetical protein
MICHTPPPLPIVAWSRIIRRPTDTDAPLVPASGGFVIAVWKLVNGTLVHHVGALPDGTGGTTYAQSAASPPVAWLTNPVTIGSAATTLRLAELLVWSTGLDAAALQTLDAYLRAKWSDLPAFASLPATTNLFLPSAEPKPVLTVFTDNILFLWEAGALDTMACADGSAPTTAGDGITQWRPAMGTIAGNSTFQPTPNATPATTVKLAVTSSGKYGLRVPAKTSGVGLYVPPNAALRLQGGTFAVAFRYVGTLPGTYMPLSLGTQVLQGTAHWWWMSNTEQSVLIRDLVYVNHRLTTPSLNQVYVCAGSVDPQHGPYWMFNNVLVSAETHPVLSGVTDDNWWQNQLSGKNAWSLGGWVYDNGVNLSMGYSCDVVVHEVVYYNRTMRTADMQALRDHLITKWA